MAKKKSALEKYCEDVGKGKIEACQKIKKLCTKLLSDIHNPGKYYFDVTRAEHAVEFIETFCKTPTGRLGTPFLLEPYEKAWIQSIFGFVDKYGKRKIREAFVLVSRKNGKTSLAAAIELYMLIADGEGAPQIYNVANTLDQAMLGFNAALKMVRQSGEIARHVRKSEDRLNCDLNFGYIKPIASNAFTSDGLDVHLAVMDEIHASRSREMYDLMIQGTAAREQPLIFQITTNGFVRNSIFDTQYEYGAKWLNGEVQNDSFIAWMYELDDREEWTDEKAWIKANPGLGTVKTIDYMRQQVQKAKDDPSYRPTVMTKDFNMPENASTAWLSFEEAVNIATYDFKKMHFGYGICGFDAADSIDLTAAQMLMMKPGDDHIYEKSMYWLPEDQLYIYESEGKERDKAPYRLWISRGLMRTVPGNRVDKRVLLDWLIELRDEEDLMTYAVAIDPWHMDDSTLRDLELLVGKGRVIKVRQGAQTLSDPMKNLRADYRANRIIDNHNPINEWCRMNVSVRTDINLNIQPEKRGGSPSNRIDGCMAEIDAYIGLNNLMADYQIAIEMFA